MIIGIDPGANGAAAIINFSGDVVDILQFNKLTEADISSGLAEFTQDDESLAFAYIEKVHAMPKQGVSSTFKFGKNFGFLIGVLTALKIPFEFVTPHTWQKSMKCKSGGDKKITKTKAQQLFPKIKVIHANADALLIAEYGRRNKAF